MRDESLSEYLGEYLGTFRAIFFARTSEDSMYTGLILLRSPDFSAAALARSRRRRWYGAAVRIVASTASLRTAPRGRIGLM